MKKLISLLIALAIVLSCAAASADLSSAKSVDPEADRKISIKKAGANPWPEPGISPTTGRNLDDVYDEYIAPNEGYDGMAATGIYYPIMVVHTGYNGAVDIGAPFYGKCADIYYEMAKGEWGVTRLAMIYNDVLPTFAGASRSLRVGYMFVRQEWNAPLFFQGMQDQAFNAKYNTDVNYIRDLLKVPSSLGKKAVPNNEKVLFDGTNGSKDWLQYKYRYKRYADANNVLWDLAAAKNGMLGERSFEDYNHTLKFGDQPEGGDDAETVYVYFSAKQACRSETSEGTTYFNSMYSYEEDEGVYYRYMITDLKDPDKNAIPFTEQQITNTSSKPFGADTRASGSSLSGDVVITDEETGAITFANVIVQHIEMVWATDVAPYPIMTGTGNADYFIGGKHYTGVWNRDTYDDRTVFYGEDGEEIALRPGRTMIVVMDSFELDGSGKKVDLNSNRYVKYE